MSTPDVRNSETTGATKNILMVTSYRRPCGIAQYVEFLEPHLNVDERLRFNIAALPVDLFRADGQHARKVSKKIFDEIVSEAARADVVCIQFEPGLFGISPFQIWSRIRRLIRSSKSVVITYHTVPPMGSKRPSFRLADLRAQVGPWRLNYIFRRLFEEIRRDPSRFKHLVQTHREFKSFSLLGIPVSTLHVEPLAFLSNEDRRKFTESVDAKNAFKAQYKIEGKKVLGCFGFLSEYKGIEVAIRAMKHLPESYHLMIVGGLHPEGIVINTVRQPYIEKLMHDLEGKYSKIAKRVHFCGALNNEEFNEAMASCDAVVLPYAEVGQTSSGPAALALDMQKPIYCSRTHCFKQLDRFEPDALSLFEIGNYLELAEKILRNDAEQTHRIEARRRYVATHNVEARAALYRNVAEDLAGRHHAK